MEHRASLAGAMNFICSKKRLNRLWGLPNPYSVGPGGFCFSLRWLNRENNQILSYDFEVINECG